MLDINFDSFYVLSLVSYLILIYFHAENVTLTIILKCLTVYSNNNDNNSYF